MVKSSFILTVKSDGVDVNYDGRSLGQCFRTWNDLKAFLACKAVEYGIATKDFKVMVSSSMDFPHEYTDDPEVIALAKMIRGN